MPVGSSLAAGAAAGRGASAAMAAAAGSVAAATASLGVAAVVSAESPPSDLSASLNRASVFVVDSHPTSKDMRANAARARETPELIRGAPGHGRDAKGATGARTWTQTNLDP